MSIAARSLTLKGCLVFLVFILVFVSTSALAQAPPRFDTILKQMLAAVRTNSYAQFMAHGDSSFQAGFTKSMFENMSRQLAPRMEKGYSTEFFGKLNQQGYVVYVWKLEFKDVQGDYLLTLFVKDEKVSGFVTR